MALHILKTFFTGIDTSTVSEMEVLEVNLQNYFWLALIKNVLINDAFLETYTSCNIQ